MLKVWIVRKYGELVAVAASQDQADRIMAAEEAAGRRGGWTSQAWTVVPDGTDWAEVLRNRG